MACWQDLEQSLRRFRQQWKAEEWSQVEQTIPTLLNSQPCCQQCAVDLETGPGRSLFDALKDVAVCRNLPRAAWDQVCRHTEGGLSQRLTTPIETLEVLLDQVRYTHDSISARYVHGAHRGIQIANVSEHILNDQIQPLEKSMSLDVVFHHSFYRSLNNRHLHA